MKTITITFLLIATGFSLYAQSFEQRVFYDVELNSRRVYKDSLGKLRLDSLSIVHSIFNDVISGKTPAHHRINIDNELRDSQIQRKIRHIDTLVDRNTSRYIHDLKFQADTVYAQERDIKRIQVCEKWSLGADGEMKKTVEALAPIAAFWNGKKHVYTKPLFWVKWTDIISKNDVTTN